MIKKEGNKFVLRSKKTGRKLGVHSSRAGAIRQERKIQMMKHKRAGRKR